MDSTHTHNSSRHGLAFTGGTFTMGYVKGSFLKQLSDEYTSLLDEEYYLYPLYDIRHVALAAYIDNAKTLSEEQKNRFYTDLVETGSLIQKLLLAKKHDSWNIEHLEKQLDKILDDIAGQIEPGLTSSSVLNHFGLDEGSVVTPYFIDSIDYEQRTHDEKLYEAAKAALLGKKQQTFFVIGGTDTQIMYAGKLTRRLIDEGIISDENKNKVIILGAMKSFGYGPEGIRETQKNEKEKFRREMSPSVSMEAYRFPKMPHLDYHPRHIGRLFRMAMELAKPSADPKKTLPPGGYILSALNENCEWLIIHDARNCLKVYSNFIDAFRSQTPAGAIYPEKGFELNLDYHSSLIATSSSQEKALYVEIAPPLISGNSTGAILNYLQAMRDYPVIIIGGIPTLGTTWEGDNIYNPQAIKTVAAATPTIPVEQTEIIVEAILNTIRERAERGVPTYYINPHIYDVNQEAIRPLIRPEEWKKSEILEEVKKAGGILLSGDTTIGIYHHIQRQLGKLSGINGPDKIRALGGTIKRKIEGDTIPAVIPLAKGDPVGIEYIPDSGAFKAGLKAAASLSKNVVLSVLPGEAIPGYIAPLVKAYPNHLFIASSKYALAVRHRKQFTQRLEDIIRPSWSLSGQVHRVPVSTYAPAVAFRVAGGHSNGDYTPEEAMSILQGMHKLGPLRQVFDALIVEFSKGGRSL